MELTFGRLSVAVRLLPARARSRGWRRRRAGPAGETAFARLIRLRRDSLHVAELEPRLLRDVGLEPARGGGAFAPRPADCILRGGLHR